MLCDSFDRNQEETAISTFHSNIGQNKLLGVFQILHSSMTQIKTAVICHVTNCLSKTRNTLNLVLLHINKWFHANQLILNVEKI